MQVVHNALAVLEEVARRQPVSMTELHRTLGLPKTNVHRALATLDAAGWLRAGSDRRWSLAPRAAVLGARAASGDGLRELARPVLETLRDETGEAVHLTVPDGDAVVLIERLDSPRAVRTYSALGARAPLHASANGKAWLAGLPEADAMLRIPDEPTRYTEHTIVEPARIVRELARVRRRGWASNRGEFLSDVAAVAAAVFSRTGDPVASISVSAPITRLPRSAESRVARPVLEAAAEISAQLGHGREASGLAAAR